MQSNESGHSLSSFVSDNGLRKLPGYCTQKLWNSNYNQQQLKAEIASKIKSIRINVDSMDSAWIKFALHELERQLSAVE